MSERLLDRSAKSSRFSKRMVAKREFKFTSPIKKTAQNKRKTQNVDPKAENSAQKSNDNVYDLPPPIWASSPRDTPYGKSKVQKKYLEISCIEPVSVRTAKNLKRIEESHFAPIATPKQSTTKSIAKVKRPLLTKWKQNKTTSVASIRHLQDSGKEVIKNKNRSKNRIAKSYQETNISHHSNKSLHKGNQSKQLSKKEKSKVWDQTDIASKNQQPKILSTSSRNTHRSPSVHSEPPRRKSKSLIQTKPNVDLPVSDQDTNKKQTSVRETVSEKGSIKRKLQKLSSPEGYESIPSKFSKLQTSRKQSIEAAYSSQSSNNYSRSTNKTKSSKRQKSDITPPRNNSSAKPKRQSGSRISQKSRSLTKDDLTSPNVTHTKQSLSKKKSLSRNSEHSTNQKKVNVSKAQNVSKSNSTHERSKSSKHNIKDSKSSQLSKLSVSQVSGESVSKNSKKNLLRKSSLTVFNLSSDEEPKKLVKGKKVSNSQEKKLKRRSTESSASGKKKTNSKSKISPSSLKKSNKSTDHSSSKLNAGKYANILSYLSTQSKQQVLNRTDKTFESIAAGVTHEVQEQLDQKNEEKQFSYDISELSSLHISHISSCSENEGDAKLNDSNQKLNEANKCLEYIMFPGDSDNNISLNNPKPIRLNVLENKNSMKRTVKSLSELDVILDVVDQSIEMVLRQITDVDKKLVISRMRNFVKEKISTDIKRQLQFIELQNTLYQKSLQVQGQQQKYFELKVANNRLNSELNDAIKTKVEDPTEMFNEFCKKFSEFKKSSNQM